ncbi:Tetratricopeptide TPR_1 repeat-containing protein [Caldalkalibacillus thermarum TA2.A1]|uniref:Tetratricopeptide TPR_1 repeat-containing protein n=1 Tax=Caldalkalibacillus thermarum (strain TA2.A1) TaxID=986075 RepID=F5L9B9_CALTT|nr:tetratricopeptide repeat protein [Caldalkalibacillus thermarum]EGL82061.1 Tetratricopeptide TPR_1 repeat-containing protein [Caldalkalibacillus thermarum TA2.A1]QZT34020.1 tetratricopeptide repeat protein [Caldalkalibacillus thermarum TA2.A1]
MGFIDIIKNVLGLGKINGNIAEHEIKSNTKWIEAMYYISKDPKKAERLLLESEKENSLKTNSRQIIDLHFTYNHLIELYYKQRDKREDALDKCIHYCKLSIELYPEFEKAQIEEDLQLIKNAYHFNPEEMDKCLKEYKYTKPRVPAFERLAIIYEKQGKYKEAIDICDKALEYGLHDKTKGGFEARKNRLLKKMEQKSN